MPETRSISNSTSTNVSLEYCGFCGDSVPDLQLHKTEFHKVFTVFQCEACGQTFEQSDLLADHFKDCTSTMQVLMNMGHTSAKSAKRAKKYECQTCGKKFTKKTLLQKHITEQHPQDDNPVSTSLVPIIPMTSSQTDKSSEENTEENEAEHEIDNENHSEIGDGDVTKTSIDNDHDANGESENGQENENDDENDENDENINENVTSSSPSATVSSSMDTTMDPEKVQWTRTPKGQWNFKCPTCGKTRTHLKRHMAIHNQSCDTCHAKFTSARALKRHKESEHPEPFPCNICGKGLTTAKIKHRHVKEVHGNKQLQCPSCPVTSTSPSNLSRHQRKKHPVSNNHSDTGDIHMELEVPETKYQIKKEFDDDIVIIGEELGAHKRYLQTCPNCTLRMHKDSLVQHMNRCYGATIAMKDLQQQLQFERLKHELAMLKQSIKKD